MKRRQHRHSLLKFETVLRFLSSLEQQLSGEADSLSVEAGELDKQRAERTTMKHLITMEGVIIIVKYGLSPICCWPPPLGSSTLFILQHNLRIWIGLVNLLANICTSLYTIYRNSHDIGKCIKVGSEVGALVAISVKIIICKVEAPRLQVLLAQMRTFLKQANSEEKEILQDYTDKLSMLHMIVSGCIILGPLSFIAGPLVTSQPFPGEAIYPFPIESNWLRAYFYTSQSVCIIQAGCMVILDIFFAMLLWYTGARFQMLSEKFRKAMSADDIIECVQEHQELIAYVNELMITARIIVVEVVVVAVYAVTTGGFVLVANPTIYDLAKYVFFEAASALELFVLSWPADNLIEVSRKVADSAYESNWIGKSPAMRRNILIVIQRSHIPIHISVSGILPALSLEFYGSTMAAAFSYLTTLRAMTAD